MRNPATIKIPNAMYHCYLGAGEFCTWKRWLGTKGVTYDPQTKTLVRKGIPYRVNQDTRSLVAA